MQGGCTPKYKPALVYSGTTDDEMYYCFERVARTNPDWFYVVAPNCDHQLTGFTHKTKAFD